MDNRIPTKQLGNPHLIDKANYDEDIFGLMSSPSTDGEIALTEPTTSQTDSIESPESERVDGYTRAMRDHITAIDTELSRGPAARPMSVMRVFYQVSPEAVLRLSAISSSEAENIITELHSLIERATKLNNQSQTPSPLSKNSKHLAIEKNFEQLSTLLDKIKQGKEHDRLMLDQDELLGVMDNSEFSQLHEYLTQMKCITTSGGDLDLPTGSDTLSPADIHKLISELNRLISISRERSIPADISYDELSLHFLRTKLFAEATKYIDISSEEVRDPISTYLSKLGGRQLLRLERITSMLRGSSANVTDLDMLITSAIVRRNNPDHGPKVGPSTETEYKFTDQDRNNFVYDKNELNDGESYRTVGQPVPETPLHRVLAMDDDGHHGFIYLTWNDGDMTTSIRLEDALARRDADDLNKHILTAIRFTDESAEFPISAQEYIFSKFATHGYLHDAPELKHYSTIMLELAEKQEKTINNPRDYVDSRLFDLSDGEFGVMKSNALTEAIETDEVLDNPDTILDYMRDHISLTTTEDQVLYLDKTLKTLSAKKKGHLRRLVSDTLEKIIKDHPDYQKLTQAYSKAKDQAIKDEIIRFVASSLEDKVKPPQVVNKKVYSLFLDFAAGPSEMEEMMVGDTTTPDLDTPDIPMMERVITPDVLGEVDMIEQVLEEKSVEAIPSISDKYDRLFAVDTPSGRREAISTMRDDIVRSAFDSKDTNPTPMDTRAKKLASLYLLSKIEETRRYIISQQNIIDDIMKQKSGKPKNKADQAEDWQSLLPMLENVRREIAI
jgi:hypothetical protein